MAGAVAWAAVLYMKECDVIELSISRWSIGGQARAYTSKSYVWSAVPDVFFFWSGAVGIMLKIDERLYPPTLVFANTYFDFMR